MNQYTLKFHNHILEQAYIDYQNKSQIKHMYNIIYINYPMLLLYNIICGLMSDYVPLAIFFVCLFNNTLFLKSIPHQKEERVLLIHEVLVFIIPLAVLAAVYFSNHPKELGISMMISLIIQVKILVTTPSILLATIQMFIYFIVILIIICFTFGWSLYILIWNPLVLFCIYNHYNSVRNQKLLFQQSQVNKSICKQYFKIDTLIKETAVDDIMFFKLNKELLKYELEFTNIDNLDLNDFLSSIVIDRKENIKQYLFSKINITNLASDKHQVVGYKNLKEKLQLEIYIQYYPELRFYIRILKVQNTYLEDEGKLILQFYNRILNKAKANPYKINFNYIRKMLCSLNAEVQIQRIMSDPYNFQLKFDELNIVSIINDCCLNLLLKLQINVELEHTSGFITTNKIILETLIYYLLRVIRHKNALINVTITNRNEYKRIIIIFNFDYELNLQVINKRKLDNKINFLQALLSNQEIFLDKRQFISFIDTHRDIPYK